MVLAYYHIVPALFIPLYLFQVSNSERLQALSTALVISLLHGGVAVILTTRAVERGS
jgi:hypothetical protein